MLDCETIHNAQFTNIGYPVSIAFAYYTQTSTTRHFELPSNYIHVVG